MRAGYVWCECGWVGIVGASECMYVGGWLHMVGWGGDGGGQVEGWV